jgi:hypothetical protein
VWLRGYRCFEHPLLGAFADSPPRCASNAWGALLLGLFLPGVRVFHLRAGSFFFLCKAFRQDPDYAQHAWGMEGGMTEQRFKLCTKRGLLVGHWVGHTGIEVEIFGWGAAGVCVRVKARGFLRALLLRDILDFRLQNC